jgi:hypothetical protein
MKSAPLGVFKHALVHLCTIFPLFLLLVHILGGGGEGRVKLYQPWTGYVEEIVKLYQSWTDYVEEIVKLYQSWTDYV